MVLFSVAAFMIALRETMEAALIISILLAYLTKTGNDAQKKNVWLGVISAIFLSIVAAVLFELIAGGFAANEKLFEGIVFTITAVFLTWMIVWMIKHGKSMGRILESKVDDALQNENKYSIFLLAFFSVFREGIETVLFFFGIGLAEETSTIIVSGLSGIIITLIASVLFFNGTIRLDLKSFFKVTGIILIFFAAGLFSRGLNEFQELGWFGGEGSFLKTVFLDLSGILNDKESTLGVMLRALFGYQDKPTWLELMAYLGYWVFVSVIYYRITIEVKNSIKPVAA